LWAELGCGRGIFTSVLADLLEADACILAIDYDLSALRQLIEGAAQWPSAATVRAVQADFRDPLPVEELDGALMANALHFVPKDHRHRVLRGVLDALRPGGLLVLAEYNTDRATVAVPHPISATAFRRLAGRLPLRAAEVVAWAPSSYLGEMYAGIGIKGPSLPSP
jgi:SAM-dependent methyltransferase